MFSLVVLRVLVVCGVLAYAGVHYEHAIRVRLPSPTQRWWARGAFAWVALTLGGVLLNQRIIIGLGFLGMGIAFGWLGWRLGRQGRGLLVVCLILFIGSALFLVFSDQHGTSLLR